MRIHFTFLPAIACSLAAGAVAQTNLAVSIFNNNVSYTQSSLPTGEQLGLEDVFISGGPDILYQHWWYFRVGGDFREYAFKRDANATRAVNGSSMTTTWPNVDGRGVLSAVLTQDVIRTGPGSGYLVESMTVTNISAAAITIELFAYTDYDIAGSFNIARGNLSSQVVISPFNATQAGEFAAVGNSGVLVAAYPVISTQLGNTLVENLPSWSTWSFGTADYTGAFQWSFAAVPPSGSVVAIDYLASMSCRPNVVYYSNGGAGAFGVPVIVAEFAVQTATFARPITYRLAAARRNALCGLMLNVQQVNMQVLGLRVLVDPNGAALLFSVTDSSGLASVPVGIPPGTMFCGLNLYGQFFVDDPAGIGGLASHTSGIWHVVGAW